MTEGVSIVLESKNGLLLNVVSRRGVHGIDGHPGEGPRGKRLDDQIETGGGSGAARVERKKCWGKDARVCDFPDS